MPANFWLKAYIWSVMRALASAVAAWKRLCSAMALAKAATRVKIIIAQKLLGSDTSNGSPAKPSGKHAKPAQLTLDQARETWLEPLERQYLTDLLAKHGGNVKVAAKAAGINTVTLYRLLKRRGLHFARTVQ